MSDIIIYGRGKTGLSLGNLLNEQGKNICFYDDNIGFDGNGKFSKDSVVILSPGVKPSARGVKAAKAVGAKIIGELEYCFPLCKGRIISVTGTNGKTTVCEMIYHVMKLVGKRCKLLGNGGTPLSSQVLDVTEQDLVVLESSSFQLDNCKSFAPYVSVFTNFANDHLDYHGSVENYASAKINNFRCQRSEAYAVFNWDDANTKEISSLCKCRKLYYSLTDKHADAYFENGKVTVRFCDEIDTADAEFLLQFAKHNQSDALAAILACRAVGLSAASIIQALGTYCFLPHRLQPVTEINGVKFVDDSKATNVHATVNALANYTGPLALILGGSSKGEPFDAIFESISDNSILVSAVGDTAEQIAETGKKFGVDVTVLYDIKHAVEYCYRKMLPLGGTVLMSNACASFDSFSGYAERGDYFQKSVRELACGEKTC